MSKKVVAIVGSYRRGGVTDMAVQAVLEGARQKHAETHTIYLSDEHIEFCTNCRQCAQVAGSERGKCVQEDDLEPMLTEIERADAVVLASPVNYGNTTAIFRRFLERLMGCSYYPWGQPGPKPRSKVLPLKAALVASGGMPGFLIPILTGTSVALETAAKLLGAKPVGKLWIGFAASEPYHRLSPKSLERARRLGMRLV